MHLVSFALLVSSMLAASQKIEEYIKHVQHLPSA